jgi:hypothetical protein
VDLIEYAPPRGTKTHPFLDCIRMMTHDEFAGLVWSVKRHGLRDPIARDQNGVIVDGRCRLMACIAAGIKPRFKTVEIDGDPRDFIISANLLRTHLNTSQKAMERAEVERWLPEPDPEFSTLVLPEARAVLEYDDLTRAIGAGQIHLAQAYDTALERNRQTALAIEEGRRLAQFRSRSPHLAIRVVDHHTLPFGSMPGR